MRHSSPHRSARTQGISRYGATLAAGVAAAGLLAFLGHRHRAHSTRRGSANDSDTTRETFHFLDGTHQMVFTRRGSGTERIVLVHGLGMGHRVFDRLATELSQYASVVALDLPGFGDSPEPGSALDMAGTGDLLAEFVTRLDLTGAVIVGHSMGTEVVVEAVTRHPGLTDRIVLIAPTVNAAERTALQQGMRMLQDLAGEPAIVFLVGTIQYLKAGPRWFVRKLRWMLDHEVEAVYPRVKAHALVIRGEFDRVCPRPWVQTVARLLPRSEYVEVPGRGHEAMISDPDPVAGMIIGHAVRHAARR